jgi:hypothetical protein
LSFPRKWESRNRAQLYLSGFLFPYQVRDKLHGNDDF